MATDGCGTNGLESSAERDGPHVGAICGQSAAGLVGIQVFPALNLWEDQEKVWVGGGTARVRVGRPRDLRQRRQAVDDQGRAEAHDAGRGRLASSGTQLRYVRTIAGTAARRRRRKGLGRIEARRLDDHACRSARRPSRDALRSRSTESRNRQEHRFQLPQTRTHRKGTTHD